jgi:hypothetical protein
MYVGDFQTWGYNVFSWQYTTDTLGDGCEMTYNTAESQVYSAFFAGYYVSKFDGWDNDNVIQIIDNIILECDYE